MLQSYSNKQTNKQNSSKQTKNKIQYPNINPHTYEHPILNKEARNTNLKKVVRIKVSGYYLENSNRPTLIALYKTNSK